METTIERGLLVSKRGGLERLPSSATLFGNIPPAVEHEAQDLCHITFHKIHKIPGSNVAGPTAVRKSEFFG